MRIVKVVPGQESATNTYDIVGNLLTTTDEAGDKTSFSYDHLSNLASKTDPDNAMTQYVYDSLGRLAKLTDPGNNVTTYTYNDLDLQTSNTIVLPTPITPGSTIMVNQNYSQTMKYNIDGSLREYTDRDGRITTYTYDPHDRLQDEAWVVNGANNQRITQRIISYTYNKADQVETETQVDYTSGSQPTISLDTYSYDPAGRLDTYTNVGTPNAPVVQIRHSYASGQLKALNASINGTTDFQNSYRYNDFGQITDIAQQAGDGGNPVAPKWVHFGYDFDGRLNAVKRYTSSNPDASPAPTPVESSAYEYNDNSRLDEIEHSITTASNGTTGTQTIESSLNYDSAGRLQSYSYNNGSDPQTTDTYNYDSSGQLLGAASSGTTQTNKTYTYDDNGNRTSINGANLAASGPYNRIPSDGQYSYLYDPEGNRTSRTDLQTGEYTSYTWDYRNRLTQVIDYTALNGTITQRTTYTYDVENRRISEKIESFSGGTLQSTEIERFAYDGPDLIYDFRASSDTDAGRLDHRYLTGGDLGQPLAQEGIDTNGNTVDVLWPLTDYQGTTRDVMRTAVAGNGSQIVSAFAHFDYDVFGNPVGVSKDNPPSTRFLYTGGEYDVASGLQYDAGNWYDPKSGKWTSLDASGDLNGYRYEENDPVNLTPGPLLGTKTSLEARDAVYQMNELTRRQARERAWAYAYNEQVNQMELDKRRNWFDRTTDAMASFSDTVTMGASYQLREKLGWNHQRIVNTSTDAYRYGGYAGQVGNIILLIGSGGASSYARGTWSAFIATTGRVGTMSINAAQVSSAAYMATNAALAGDKSQAMLLAANGLLALTRVRSWSGATNRALAAGQIGLHAYGSAQAMAGAYQRFQQEDYIGAGLDVLEAGIQGYRTFVGCFAAGTPLLSPQGSKAIEKFEKNDPILTRSEDGADRPVVVSYVEEVFVREAFILVLTVAGRKIRTTSEHPFWVLGHGWMPAGQLQVGDLLSSHDGQWVMLEGLENTGEIETVYNLRVAQHHTYFIGDETWGFSVWAHNAYQVEYDGRSRMSRIAADYRAAQARAGSPILRVGTWPSLGIKR